MSFLAILAAAITVGSSASRAADTNNVPESIGVYDSRVVAFAYFWSAAQQKKIAGMAKAAQDAKAAGQTDRSKELAAPLNKEQQQIHLQVFSTAPVGDALAEIRDRLPLIKKEAGVSELISKWDEAALKQHSKARQVDLTDALAREFKPDDKQLKTMAEIKRNKPMPLDQMKNIKGD